jgi:DNA-binding winged helix-turn-helix (wHTH) protein
MSTTTSTHGSAVAFGSFVLCPRSKLLLEDHQPVKLGSRSMDLLIALVERAGRVVGRTELEACVWPRAVVEATSLRVHASRLRKALRDGQGERRYIVNIPGQGYLFAAAVQGVEPSGLFRDAQELIAVAARTRQVLSALRSTDIPVEQAGIGSLVGAVEDLTNAVHRAASRGSLVGH